MTSLKQITVVQIKAARSVQEVEKAIFDSLNTIQSDQINRIPAKSFIGDMIISLLMVKNQTISPGSRRNIMRAVEIFKKLL
jgi:hypothetical protein